MCALKWGRLDSETRVLTIRSSIAQQGRKTWEKDTKTHQQRRITLDEQTFALLQAYSRHCAERAGIGTEMPGEARMAPGAQLPTLTSLMERYEVSAGTAQRAIAQLRAAGLVTVSRGKQAVVADPASTDDAAPADVVNLVARRSTPERV